jgi:hypothetical protein
VGGSVNKDRGGGGGGGGCGTFLWSIMYWTKRGCINKSRKGNEKANKTQKVQGREDIWWRLYIYKREKINKIN